MDEWGEVKNLRAAAEALIDATKVRIATVNRVERAGVADALLGQTMRENAESFERICQAQLIDVCKAVVPTSVRQWADETPGLGSKGVVFAKLLGLIGNPRIAEPKHWEIIDGTRVLAYDEPYARSVSQLWAYSGCGDPARRPENVAKGDQAGMLACGRRRHVRPLLYTFSSGLQRMHTRNENVENSYLWKVFVQAKEYGLTRRHEVQCQTSKPAPRSNGCGTRKNPELGEPGSTWRPGHAQAHAHRMVAKELLRQLWEVSG